MVGDALVRREVVYALMCEKEDDRVVGDRKWQTVGGGKKCGNGGTASCPTGSPKKHACDEERWVEKVYCGMFGADDKR